MARQTRVSRREKSRKRFENGRGIFGTKQAGNLCEFLGIVNHRPKLFVQISRQISGKIPRPKNKFFALNFASDFAPVLAQPAGFPLRWLSAFETPQKTGAPLRLRLLGKPLPPLSWCAITWRLATSHMCDQDERQR